MRSALNIRPLTGIEILYNTSFEILSRTEFKWLEAMEIKDKIGALKVAYEQAKHLFRWEFRRDGKRYFEHLKSVTDIVLKELPHPSLNKVIVAMLHDMMEDTEVDFQTLKRIFGEEIATAVNLLTKKTIDHYMPDSPERDQVAAMATKEEKEAFYKQNKKNLKPFKENWYYSELFGSANDLAISVKIADRMHNLRDMLGSTHPDKIVEYIEETEQFILPGLAWFWEKYSIGISHLKAYLANLKIYLTTLQTWNQLTEVLK